MRRPSMTDGPDGVPSGTPAPIGSYGLLGDTRTAALVSDGGAIDWLCVPRFDGEPLFGRLVGGPPAGTFRVGPAGPATLVERHYRRNTATLETTWAVDGGRLALTEAMVAEVAGRLLPATVLVRRLSAETGPVDAVIEFDPRLGVQRRARGFDTVKAAYVRSYNSTELDAALLVLPLLGIDDPESPRVQGTIDAIRDELSAGGPLLYRYPPGRDGLPGTEGAFLPCSFWLVQALARTGRRPEALELFQTLLEHASPLGLYAEEMDPATGAHLGNYPQTLTHAALIQAALAIRDAHRLPRPATPAGSATRRAAR